MRVIDHFIELTEEGLPWWYNERASVSVFAAAVWRVGGIALEEATATKENAARPRFRETDAVQGRCDLYFRLGSDDFQAEAKQLWLPGTVRGKNITAEINAALREASDDASRNDAEQGRRIAMVFVAPSLSETSADGIQDYLENLLERIGEVECSASAWTFLEDAKHAAGVEVRGGVRYYPGVAVFIKWVA